MPGRRRALSVFGLRALSVFGLRALSVFGLMVGLFCCVVLWAAAHYEFGFYFDRARCRGSRIYRINSYEQFMKEKAGDDAFLMA
jgi:hypothetical protein